MLHVLANEISHIIIGGGGQAIISWLMTKKIVCFLLKSMPPESANLVYLESVWALRIKVFSMY